MKLVGVIVENVHKTSNEAASSFWTPPCLVACRTTWYNSSSIQTPIMF